MSLHIKPEEVHAALGRTILADGFEFVLDLDKSKGSWIHDSRSGRKFLDLFTFFASSPIGYNHPRLVHPETQKKLGRVSVNKPSNSDVYTTELAEFVETFREIAMPKSFRYGFFVEGGSVAVENALKVAFDYKVRRNFSKGAKNEVGAKVVHFRNAFHGRTGYTLSLTNTVPDKIAYFPKFNWPRFETPGLRFPADAQVLKDVAAKEEEILGQIRDLGKREGDDVACLIMETIQGEGGDVHFRKEFYQGLRKICDEFDWLLIFDEVQAGMGLTGKMWAFEHFGVEPDIAVFGKKSQVCGLMSRDTVDREPKNVFHVPSRINSTWGGNLIDMVRCQIYLEVIRDEKLLENTTKQGSRLLTGLEKIQTESGGKVWNARGRGLMAAFSFSQSDLRGKFLENLYEQGAIMLPCGSDSVRFRPPLTISTEEIDQALTMIQKAVKAL